MCSCSSSSQEGAHAQLEVHFVGLGNVLRPHRHGNSVICIPPEQESIVDIHTPFVPAERFGKGFSHARLSAYYAKRVGHYKKNKA